MGTLSGRGCLAWATGVRIERRAPGHVAASGVGFGVSRPAYGSHDRAVNRGKLSGNMGNGFFFPLMDRQSCLGGLVGGDPSDVGTLVAP